VNLIKNLKSVLSLAQAANSEARAAHERIELLTQRVAQIEHYAGMRNHKFPANNQRWQFRQIRNDINRTGAAREKVQLREVA
jgi:hypothetical protein